MLKKENILNTKEAIIRLDTLVNNLDNFVSTLEEQKTTLDLKSLDYIKLEKKKIEKELMEITRVIKDSYEN